MSNEPDPETGTNEDPQQFMGQTIGGQFQVIGVLRERPYRNQVLRVLDTRLEREAVLKIAKPGLPPRRVETILEEGRKLAKIKHPNVPEIYHAGEHDGRPFLVEELVEGTTLKQYFADGERFSIRRALSITNGITDAVRHANDLKIERHGDLVPGNIIEREGKPGECVVIDFVPPFTDRQTGRDIHATGLLLETMLENSSQRVPRRIQNLADRAKAEEYDSMHKLGKAVGTEVAIRHPRRIFLRQAGILTTGLLANNMYEGSLDRQERELEAQRSRDKSLENKVNQIRETSPGSPKSVRLLSRLGKKLARDKVRGLRMSRREYPYQIPQGKTDWTKQGGESWSDGFWPRMNFRAHQMIGDQFLLRRGVAAAKGIKFFPKNGELDSRLARFFPGHSLGFEVTQDEELRDTALKAAGRIVNENFHEKGEYIQPGGVMEPERNLHQIYTSTMGLDIPFLSWAFQQTGDERILNALTTHARSALRYSVNEDGSVVQRVNFNSDGRQRLGGYKSSFRSHSYSAESCLARAQPRMTRGFLSAFQASGDRTFLQAAEATANYLSDNLPEDGIPFYDFKAPITDSSGRTIPKDTSSASIAASTLLDLSETTGNPKYRKTAGKILHGLAANHLSGEDHQGLLLDGCNNAHIPTRRSAGLIYSDSHFLDSLAKIEG